MESVISRLTSMLISLPAILMALSLHELSHGYAAYLLGDPTAKLNGRLSMNPLRHFDLFGFLFLLIFRMGWAKPVNIDVRYLKNPKRDIAVISLAGPLSNFALAFVSSFLYVLAVRIGASFSFLSSSFFLVLLSVLSAMITINLGLGIFNLIPIPPLDGSKILYAFLPYQVLFKIRGYERYMTLALFLLAFSGILSGPIYGMVELISGFFLNLAQGVIF